MNDDEKQPNRRKPAKYDVARDGIVFALAIYQALCLLSASGAPLARVVKCCSVSATASAASSSSIP